MYCNKNFSGKCWDIFGQKLAAPPGEPGTGVQITYGTTACVRRPQNLHFYNSVDFIASVASYIICMYVLRM